VDDLVEFLRDRYDEDEQVACNAAADHPTWTYDPERFAVYTEGYPIASHRFGDPLTDADGTHIALHDPARVLHDVESKRRILDQCESALSVEHPIPHDKTGAAALASMTLVFLALPYADHPDFREDWRP
jgi:uncharacterized protein DUF6221